MMDLMEENEEQVGITLKCIRSNYHYPINWGKEYSVIEARNGEYKIPITYGRNEKGYLWVTLKNRDYEFKVVE